MANLDTGQLPTPTSLEEVESVSFLFKPVYSSPKLLYENPAFVALPYSKRIRDVL
jgi:hypothetical protein